MNSLSHQLAAACHPDWAGLLDAAQCERLKEVVRAAFIDTAACVLAGRRMPSTTAVIDWARIQFAPGTDARLLFGEQTLTSAGAAIVNATAGHALDYDDAGLAGHPSVVLVPALWAEHERTGIGGWPLIQAYAKGYAVWADLQGRMKVTLHDRGWHPTSVFGSIAAAAAVASLRGVPPALAAHSLGVAASMTGGVVANFGSSTKPLHAGLAAARGIAAVGLAEAGLDASADALDGAAGLLRALGGPGNADTETPVPGDLPSTLLRKPPGIKKYPVCYAGHRVADGVLDLVKVHGVRLDDVVSAECWIGDAAARVLRQHNPGTVNEARFSLEFIVAAALRHGGLGAVHVDDVTLADSPVRELMGQVRTQLVHTSCPIEPSFAFSDRVTLSLRDGRVLDSGEIRFARGHAQLPLSRAELEAKLFACVGEDEQWLAGSVLQQIDDVMAAPAVTSAAA